MKACPKLTIISQPTSNEDKDVLAFKNKLVELEERRLKDKAFLEETRKTVLREETKRKLRQKEMLEAQRILHTKIEIDLNKIL